MTLPNVSQGPYLTLNTAVEVLRAGLDTAMEEIETEISSEITLDRLGDAQWSVQAGDVRGMAPQAYPAFRVVNVQADYRHGDAGGLVVIEHRFLVRVYCQSAEGHDTEQTTVALLERRTALYEAAVRRVIERDLNEESGATGVYAVFAERSTFIEPAVNSSSRRAITQVVECGFIVHQKARRSHHAA